ARCYSLSSAPGIDSLMKITVKRVADGLVSNWICDEVCAGMTLEMLTPAGTFTPASFDDDLLLVAGGSGITPIMSIIKAALAHGKGRLALVYANRDERSVIFAEELRRFSADHPDRLTVRHWYDVQSGPPSPGSLASLLRPYADRDAYVCGP